MELRVALYTNFICWTRISAGTRKAENITFYGTASSAISDEEEPGENMGLEPHRDTFRSGELLAMT